jgi:hypothetical protein
LRDCFLNVLNALFVCDKCKTCCAPATCGCGAAAPACETCGCGGAAPAPVGTPAVAPPAPAPKTTPKAAPLPSAPKADPSASLYPSRSIYSVDVVRN